MLRHRNRLKRFFAIFLGIHLWVSSAFAGALCHGRLLNPLTDINWDLIFPITIAGARVPIGTGNLNSPLTDTSPLCVCPSHLLGLPMPGISVSYHVPLFVEEIVKRPGCFSSLGGEQLLVGFSTEQTDLKQDENSTSRWQVHWYEYPIFAMLQLFEDFVCFKGGDYALTYITELDPTWQNDLWGALFSPEGVIFANPLAQAACSLDAVGATFHFPLDALFWCAGSWGSVYPLTGNMNASEDRLQSAELAGAKMIARLSRTGLLWDTVGPWAQCTPAPMPIWIKSEFTVDPVYPIVSHHLGMPIGAAPALWMYLPPQSFPMFENVNQVIFQEQQCCLTL